MPLKPKRNIAALKAVVHGGLNYAELNEMGIDPDKILDFSVSTNPFMPPPGFMAGLLNSPVERYPDSQATGLRQRLAARLQISPDTILIGSGTTEIIRLIALTYFRQGDPVLILEPTYGDYEIACRIAGARPVKHRGLEEDDFAPKLPELTAIIRKRRPRAVFICNPNNPTGKYLSRADVVKVTGTPGDTLLILDEAYIAFVAQSWDSLALVERGNVIILRSMTKDYGLPGLRLGYAVARREIIDSLRLVQPPWNVNVIAQAAGIAVLKQDDYLKKSLVKVRDAKQFLTASLEKLGFTMLPSDTHYFLVKVGNAPACRRALMRYGIMVRDCSSFGLPEYIRISPLALPECERLIEAFKEILSSQEGIFEDPRTKLILKEISAT